MYTAFPTGSTAAASWLNDPIAGRSTPWPAFSGSHSQTCPPTRSSHESHVFQGVGPPEQLPPVPSRMLYALAMSPFFANFSAPTPPSGAGSSELDT